MFKLLDTVALTHDMPEVSLRRGDLGAIVEVHAPDAWEVEFVAASGRTQALVTLTGADLRHIGDQDVIAVRSLAAADA
jgi:pyridoxine 5'-phosphate synthase PdxJ